LAVEAYAKAVEGLVTTLIENSGLDPIDILVKLRSMHESPNGLWYGINAVSNEIQDMMRYT